MTPNNYSHGIPAWLLEKNKSVGHIKHTKTSFLTKTFKVLSGVIQNEVYSEKFVHVKGYLQMIDARVKLVTLLFYMVLCAVTTSAFTLILLAFIVMGFIKLSGLNMKSYLKRVWLIVPLIVFVMSIPATTSFFVKGTPLFYIYQSQDMSRQLYISSIGLTMILKMAIRIGVSISFAYLLIMTTRWADITKALSVFRVPPLVITMLHMTYRYIFMLSKIASELMEARFLRMVGHTKNKSNRAFVANSMSFLFIKASYLSDELYDAMRCRGFSGEPVSLQQFRIQKIDFLWIANNIVITMVLLMGEILH
ncbi:MAG: cobalt ECF transporter T component CbiQ [Hyphomonadaceae bacterium]|nr:cobalt ECF transporter T component CbiQ [Clostridia bacterium]